MLIAQGLFYFSAIGAVVYMLLKKRLMDWFSVATFSAIVYFMPGFLGYSLAPDLVTVHALQTETYLVYFLVFTSIFVGAICNDVIVRETRLRGRTTRLKLPGDQYTAVVLTVIAIIALVFAIVEMGEAAMSAEKAIAMEKQGRWMIAYEFSACLALLGFLAERRVRGVVVGFVLVLPLVFFGDRTAAVMTFIAAVLIQRRHKSAVVLGQKWGYGIVGVAAIYLTIILKQFLFAIKFGFESGQWGLLFDHILNPDAYVDAVFNSEPFLVQNTLNEVIKVHFSVGAEQLQGLLIAIIPFANEAGIESKGFNDYFQPTLFSGVDYGLAANIWAQAYSLGGLGAVIIFAFFFVLVLLVINRWFAKSSGSLVPAVALAGSYWAFYIHRNDLLYQLLLERRVIGLLLIGWLISYALSRCKVRRGSTIRAPQQ